MKARLLGVVLGGLAAAYPLVVYLGITRVDPKWLALLLATLAIGRALWARTAFWWVAASAACGLALLTGFGHGLVPLKLYPVLMSTLMLCLFGFSLWRGPTVIERLARLSDPDLPPEGVAYTRKVTQVWCGFFILNGLVALGTAVWGSDQVWALYNGLISYGLMGVLLGAEWCVRQRLLSKRKAESLHV